MKWNEFIELPKNPVNFQSRIKTGIECPVCGEFIWKRVDIILPSYPPKNQYECDNCGWVGYD